MQFEPQMTQMFAESFGLQLWTIGDVWAGKVAGADLRESAQSAVPWSSRDEGNDGLQCSFSRR
jgi:hypothetical protein